MACGRLGAALGPLLEYDTIKTVHIRSKKVGLIFRLIQLAIIGYIVGYVIVYSKGYQEIDQAVSTVVTKIKGASVTCNDQQPVATCANSSLRVWDTVDYTIPAQENNAFFVVTNFVETPGQQQRAEGWDEDVNASTSGSNMVYKCTDDSQCPRFAVSRNGVLTGACNTSLQRCRIFGWGPVELNAADTRAETPGANSQMPGVVNYTVFIKNNIFFPKLNARFTNVGVGNSSSAYLTTCIWSRDKDPYCPVFRLGDVLAAAGITMQSFLSQEVVTGAVITVGMRYTCDLDKGGDCPPDITFTRTDDQRLSISKGYNFRFAYYDTDTNGTVHRDLYKFYGLRFVFVVSGTAGRFNIIPLFVAFGSGIGLLGVATIVADLMVTKVLKRHDFYKQHKYEYVDDEETERNGEKQGLLMHQ